MRWFAWMLGLVGIACGGDALSRQPVTAAVAVAAALHEERADADARAALVQHTVTADDGHALTVWSRAPAHPRHAILLVHGRTWSGRPDFDLQVEGEQASTLALFADEGIAAFAIDLRGYGSTARDATGFLTPDRAVKDLVEVLAWIRTQVPGERAPALLGWSLGALSAQLVAQRHPDHVSTLVLYGYPRAAHQHYEPSKDTKPARQPTTDAGAREDFLVPGAVSPALVAAFVAAARTADPVRADWHGLEQWNALDPERVRVPVLVLHGVADPYAPIARQAELFVALAHPDRAWIVLPNADHAAHLEQGGRPFVHAVVSFLDRPRAIDSSASTASSG